MAEGNQFNPQLPDVNNESYLNYSRGIDANNAIGVGLSGKADLLDKGLSAADKVVKEKVRVDETTAVDYTRDLEIERGAQMLGYKTGAVNGSAKLPPDLKQAIDRAATMSDAKEAGRIGGSHYMMLLDATARQLRAKYPGYREHIDNVMSDLAGVTPANKLLTDLQAEIKSGQTDTQKMQAHFVDTALKNGTHPDWYKATSEFGVTTKDGKPVAFSEYMNDVNQITRDKYQIEVNKDRMASQKATRELTKETVLDSAHAEISVDLQNMMRSATGPVADYIQKVNTLQENAKNRPLTEQEQTQARAAMGSIRSSFLAAQRDKLYSIDPKRGFSYASVIGDKGVEDVLKSYEGYMKTLEDGFTNNDFGVAKFNASMIESMKNADLANANKFDPTVRKIELVKNVYGPQGLSVVMGFSPAIKAWGTSLFAQAANLEPTKPLGQKFEEIRQMGNKDKDTYNNVVNESVRILTDPMSPENLVKDQAKGMFGPENANFLTKISDPFPQFLKIAGNPAVVQKMSQLKTTDPETYNNYRNWTTGSFQQLTVPLANEANSIASTQGFNVTYDPKSYSYRLDADSEFLRNSATGKSMERVINNLNTSIQSVVPMLKAEGGDVQAQVDGLVQGLGINTSATKLPGTATTLWDMLDNSVRKAQGLPPSSGPGSSTGTQPAHIAPLLDLTGKLEAGKHGYNEVYGRQGPQDLTNKTVAEVFKMQDQLRAEGAKSTAAGKYQFINQTLKDQIAKLGIDPETTKFTPELQDRLAIGLMKERGLDDFLAGDLSKERFADRLASVWAAFPGASGKSRYESDGLNKAGIGRKQFEDFLGKIQDQYRSSSPQLRNGMSSNDTHPHAGAPVDPSKEGYGATGPNGERYVVRNGKLEPM